MSKTSCPSLDAVWCRADRKDEICYTCGGMIGATTLFRTFQVDRSNHRPVFMPGSRRRCALGRTITVFDRHFECAQIHRVAYVAVSHVWHKLISILHSCGTEQLHDNPETATKASNLIFREVIAVYDGFCESYGRPLEMWLDYLSIPQWAHETKVNILMNIGNIYASSLLTLVFWHDVDQTAVQVIRRSNGAPTDILIAAITHICSGAWQRRMWTAMEYLRSAQVRVMLRGYILCDDGDDLFMAKIEELWQQASDHLGSMLDLEATAGLHRNHLVPWQIRGLTSTRKSSANHFALAFQHLALKGCAVPLDFYYALGGLVGFQERLVPQLAGARWQIMKFCMEKQDYSPILMPTLSTHSEQRFFFGFNDIRSWGLGPAVSQARKRLSVRGTRAVFHAQPVGELIFADPSFWEEIPSDQVEHLLQPAQIVLASTGSNVEEFTVALCLRILGTNPYAALRRLDRSGRRSELQETLCMLQTFSRLNLQWPREFVVQIISDLGLDDASLDLEYRSEDRERQPGFWRSWQINNKPGTFSPMAWAMQNGTSVHLGEQSAYIGMICPACHGTIACRAALYEPHTNVIGAVGFRIPGLQYDRTIPEGLGILVSNHTIVGRFLYCCPCCSNVPTCEIEVDMPAIPLPCHNPKMYVENHVT